VPSPASFGQRDTRDEPAAGFCRGRTQCGHHAPSGRTGWLAETSEQARQDVKFGLEDFTRNFSEVATFPIIPPDVTLDPAEYLVSSGLACIGTPSDCIRHFERLWKGSNGGFGGILSLAHNWADWPATKRSYELMARYVHPHFQHNSNELRDWSYDDAKSKYTTAGLQSKAAVQAAIDTYQRRKG
jgi:limonene 1,2-monooxygenase